MAWDAGTITDAAPWAALSAKIQALCGGTGAESWEYLENIPAGTGLGQSGDAGYSLDVFVCHGTNSRPDDVGYENKLSASDTNAGASTSIVFAGVGALAANKVFSVVVVNTKATAADDPTSVTLDGANAPTFTKIASKIGGDATGIIKVSIWLGKSGASAPTGTNLTVVWPAAPTAAICNLDEWSGLDETLGVTGIDGTGATQVCIQAGDASGTNQTAHTVTVGAPLAVTNALFQAAAETASTGTYSPQSAQCISSAVSKSVATPNAVMRTQMRPDVETTTITLTLSSAASETSWASIALELQPKTKSTAYTLSDASRDWFFVMEIPVPDGAVASVFNAFERYDPAAGIKAFSSPCPANGSGNPSGSGHWKTIGWSTYTGVNYNNRANLSHGSLNTSGFNYWIKMTRNSIHVGTKVGLVEFTSGAALIDSFVTGHADPCPLIMSRLTASTNTTDTFSSLPGVASVSASSSAWAGSVTGWTLALQSDVTYNLANRFDLWQDGKIHVGRLAVFHADGWGAAAYTSGFARGLYKTDFLAISDAGGTVNLGDTVTIDGNTWTVIGTGYLGSTNSQKVVLVTRAT